MSHLLPKGFGGLIGDVVGGTAGFLLGGPAGAAVGAGLGGFGGSAASGGSIGSDLLSGIGGAAAGYGLGSAAAGLGLGGGGAVDAAAGVSGADATLGGVGAGGGEAAATAGTASSAASSLGLGTAPLATAGPSAASVMALGDPGDFTSPASVAMDAGGGAPLGTGVSTAAPASTAGTVSGAASGLPGGSISAASGADTPGAGIAQLWNKTTDWIGGALDSATGKDLGVAAQLGLVGRNLLANNGLKGANNLSSIAGQEAAQGSILSSYLTSGTLPPAVQAAVNQATQDGITALKSKYASMGIAPGSTQETADIARLQQNAVVQGATLADQLLSQGLSQTNMSGQLYGELVKLNQSQSQETQNAITGLATALAGGGTRIQIGGTTNG